MTTNFCRHQIAIYLIAVFSPSLRCQCFGGTLIQSQSVLQENVDTTNAATMSSQDSDIVMDSRALALDPTLKSGKIKKIHLRNFMCHSNFEVNLNKNVNVFVGLNGSGKSAILSALTIGLGSKASSTARSTSLKDLVKQGETSSTIEITIMNDGFDSYEGKVVITNVLYFY